MKSLLIEKRLGLLYENADLSLFLSYCVLAMRSTTR